MVSRSTEATIPIAAKAGSLMTARNCMESSSKKAFSMDASHYRWSKTKLRMGRGPGLPTIIPTEGTVFFGFVNAMIDWGLSFDDLAPPKLKKLKHLSPQHYFTSRLFPQQNDVKTESDDDSAFLLSSSKKPDEHHFTNRFNFPESECHLFLPPIEHSRNESSNRSDDVALLNGALLSCPTMHAKQELIGLVFEKTNLTCNEIHAKLPAVSLSTIKRGMQKTAQGTHKFELADKQHSHENGRNRMYDYERDFFKETMKPFFTMPISGAKENKAGTALWRTVYTDLTLWTHYLRIHHKIIAKASLCNNLAVAEQKKRPYDHLDADPRGYDYFQHTLLKLIYYTLETNPKRCHYCEDFEKAKAEMAEMQERCDRGDSTVLPDDLDKLRVRIAIGTKHTARWFHQNGYICRLRDSPPQDTCLVQTDYFGFYTITFKMNVLCLVLSYVGKEGKMCKEYVHYYSKHNHDYVFTTVGFNHAFANKSADILSNGHGVKFKNERRLNRRHSDVQGPFPLRSQAIIVDPLGFDSVRVVPFCAKHGPNECDGSGARVKRIADRMLIDGNFDETKPALFCGIVMQGAPDLRAYPMFHNIAPNKPWVDSLMPGGSVDKLYPPKRGIGEYMITGTPSMCLKARTLVEVREPWRLDAAMGYPLTNDQVERADSWTLVDLQNNPKTQCIPCAAFFGRPVLKDTHVNCLFSTFTQHRRCGQCGARSGHNKRNCPSRENGSLRSAMTREQLVLICLGNKLSASGTKADLLQRIDSYEADSMPELEAVDVIVKEEELESESELSDEQPEAD